MKTNTEQKKKVLEDIKQQLMNLEMGNPPPADAGIFGATIPLDKAQLVIMAAPCELTTSYGKGTKNTPSMIREPSHQLDLLDLSFGLPYQAGIAIDDSLVKEIIALEKQGIDASERVLDCFEQNKSVNSEDLAIINDLTNRIHKSIEERASYHLSCGKHIAILGGDHSVPLGVLKALARKHKNFGVLHIDAHHDLRNAFEGFTHSHASIMFNALEQIPEIQKLVSIGIRDFSQSEYEYAKHSSKVTTLYESEKFKEISAGKTFDEIYTPLIEQLPQEVYLSFDIDGLDPSMCPHTGTPVPGGLSYNEAIWLVDKLIASGRIVIGFDLCEVAPGEDDWDLNVGARILYKLSGSLVHSNRIGKAWEQA